MNSGNLEANRCIHPRGTTMSLLRHLLTAPTSVPDQPSIDDWWRAFTGVCGQWPAPVERAIAAGFAADRVAWAFCSGYQAALRALLPSLPDAAIAALCATEKDGNRPKAIQTRLSRTDAGWRLSGHKKWTTLGPASSLLLVVARLDDGDAGRPALKVVRIAGDVPGVRLQAMPATRFVPEAPHAEVYLTDVAVRDDQVLDGDGYERYLKPFRTVEDIHVQAAVLAYLVREARHREWPRPFIEQTVSCLLTLVDLAGRDPSDSVTHIALAGALAQSGERFVQADELWRTAGDGAAAAARWLRDRSLMQVAGTARQQRSERAWERLAES